MASVNIIKEKWDYLIILDACRYDYFKAMHTDYLEGELSKRTTAGTCTGQWRDLNFPDYYDDIVYISANPHFTRNIPVEGYTAGEHFHKVYEIWRNGWKGGLVLPELVTDASPEIIAKHPGKRFIIHYLQPHTPYIILGEDAKGYEQSHGEPGRKIIGEEDYKNAPKYKKEIFNRLLKLFKGNKILGNHPQWFLRKWLRLPPRNPVEVVIRQYNKKVLRNAYRANLKFALVQVARLVKQLSGRIVISSDHGEFLGENRCYAHPPSSDSPILREVPWLVIEKEQADIEPEIHTIGKITETRKFANKLSDEEEVREKLRDLGYLQ